MTAFRRLLAWLHVAWFGPYDPHVWGEVRCVNCGWEGVSVVSASSPCYDPETGCLDMLECPDCGLFLVCSV
jgi:hypothetical protein